MSERPHEQPLSADEAAQARAASYLGRVISRRYRIDGVLAMGGMGAVYRGEHVRMHKRVAIKILHPDTERLPELVRRFEREAIAGAHVQHPNVATATDFGEDEDGSFFLVLEHVRGATLHEIIRRGPMAVPRALHIARQLAAGLGAAHAMNIIHRDVKPRNVMVVEAQDDLVKLIDFGLALVSVEHLRVSAAAPEAQGGAGDLDFERLTTAGTIFGTIAYLAPEAAYGMELVDARSDLYAVGLILYELLAGKHPFLAVDPIELFNQQRSAKVPAIAEHAPGVEVPAAVEAVVRRLLEKHPDARYESAAALIAALDEVGAALGLPLETASAPVSVRFPGGLLRGAGGAGPPSTRAPDVASPPSTRSPGARPSTSTPELFMGRSSLMVVDEETADEPTQVRSSRDFSSAALSGSEATERARSAHELVGNALSAEGPRTPRDGRELLDELSPAAEATTHVRSSRELLGGLADELRADLAGGGGASGVAADPANAAGGRAMDARAVAPQRFPSTVSSASGQAGPAPPVPLFGEPPPPESVPSSFGSRRAMAPTSMQDLVAADAAERAAERATADAAIRASRADPHASRASLAPRTALAARIALWVGVGVILAGVVAAFVGRRSTTAAPPAPEVQTPAIEGSASAAPPADPNAAPADPAVAPIDGAAAPPDGAAAPADGAAAPADPGASAAPPAEPPADEAARQALLDAAKARHWVEAGDALAALGARDPAALGDRKVAVAAREVAIAIAKTGGEHADAVFDALANRLGARGIDVLYEIIETRGRSTPATRAGALLRTPEVAARGTPAVRIAFELRDSTCGEKMGLLDRALAEGDRRTLVVLQTVVRPCFKKNRAVDEAIGAMRDRFGAE